MTTPEGNNSTGVFVYTSGQVTAETSIVEFGPSVHRTGICFLDHMVDQLTSHGQLGVTMSVFTTSSETKHRCPHVPHVDYAGGSLREEDRIHDEDIFLATGATLGMALRELVQLRTGGPSALLPPTSPSAKSTSTSTGSGRSTTQVFCCPLDEAFVEATLQLSTATLTAPCTDFRCQLAPYGNFYNKEKNTKTDGRRWIGCYPCHYTSLFFETLAISLGASQLTFQKIRGQNAHHIVEATFKSFARVFRACLDDLTAMAPTRSIMGTLEEEKKNNEDTHNTSRSEPPQPPPPHRTGSRSRRTKETTIEVHVDLDKPAPESSLTTTTRPSDISTGVELTDQVFHAIRTCAGFYLSVECHGDSYIDDHHTSEDVAITVGQCVLQALGNKAGLTRMGWAEIVVPNTQNTVKVRCVMDLSNRPYFEWNLTPFYDEEYVGGDTVAFAAMRRGAQVYNQQQPQDQTNKNSTTVPMAKMMCGAALTCEMLLHIFESLTIETRATVHLELITTPALEGVTTVTTTTTERSSTDINTLDLAFAAAQAYGTALAACVRIDPRRAGKVASSKGTLSV